MNIKRLSGKLTAAFVILAALFTGCDPEAGNIFNGKEEGDKAVVSFSFTEEIARTVNPSYDLSNFTDIKISYKQSGSASETVIVSGKKYSELTEGSYTSELLTGTYNFYATAKVANMNFSAKVENKPISNSNNTVNFAFERSSTTAASGTGFINIAFTVSDTKVKAVKGTLYNYDNESVKITTQTLTLNSTNPAAKTFAYKINADSDALTASIAGGTYSLVLDFYADEEAALKLGCYNEIVNVSDGLTSSAERSFTDVGKIYSITYNLNGGNFAGGVTVPGNVTHFTSAITLPTAAQMNKTDAVLEGWYLTEDFQGAPVTSISNFSKDINLYAKWRSFITFEGNNTFTLSYKNESERTKAWNGTVYYSTDKLTWAEWNKTDTSTIPSSTVSDGKAYVYLCGIDNDGFAQCDESGNLEKYTVLKFEGDADSVACSGNIMSLLDSFNPDDAEMNDYCFYRLFEDCNKLTSAPSLPSKNLTNSCYGELFYNCSKLAVAPDLPATTLAEYCYNYMFRGCSSLITAPELPATTLAENCYSNMFKGCTELKNIPDELPAETLADYCYFYMFYGCSKLETSPELPATTLADYCYSNMFEDCTSLKTVHNLPATNLEEYCYNEMFRGCSALESTPSLAAKNLAQSCCYYMFKGCSSLVNVPSELPATTLARSCYSGMFQDCSKLKTAPSLPAEELAEWCYSSMFEGCTLLEAAPALPATTLENNCYKYMFQKCSSLTSTPELKATVLKSDCYASMFKQCTSLTTIGKIGNGTTINNIPAEAFNWMFEGCSSLKVVESTDAADPTRFISIGTLNGGSYDVVKDMFKDCKTGSATAQANKAYKYIVPTAISGSVALSGETYTDETLTATYTPGAAEETYTYQWYRVEGPIESLTETAITGATASTYKLVSADVGKRIKVVVTGSGDYFGTKESSLTSNIATPTYKINWNTTSFFDSGTNTVYKKAKTAKTIIIGKKADYETTVSSLTKVKCGETASDMVYAYYDDTTDAEKLYVLASEKIVFEDDDLIDSNNGSFSDCTKATSIILDNIDTSNITNMTGMFYNCQVLQTLNLSSFNTANVTNMSYMFFNCVKLTSITFGENFDTSNVVQMGRMFYRCLALLEVNPGQKFKGTKVQSLRQMFMSCSSLQTVDLSYFDNSVATDMYEMFYDCVELTSVSFATGFTCASVETMEEMFNNCKKIAELNLTYFNTTSLTNTVNMFANCNALSSITFGENFNISNVTKINFMFYYCKKLETIDLSTFNFSNVTEMKNVFSGCELLTTIYVKENTDLSQNEAITSSGSMFSGCVKIKGSNGTTYDYNHMDKSYARVDTAENPGYFSVKSE